MIFKILLKYFKKLFTTIRYVLKQKQSKIKLFKGIHFQNFVYLL